MLGMFSGIGGSEILLVVLAVLILFGSKRIPEFARGLGKVVRELRRSLREIQEEVENSQPSQKACGVDVGIKHLATLDDGLQFENPNALSALEERLRRQQKRVSRRKKSS